MCPVLRSCPRKTIGKIIEGKIILSKYRKKFGKNLLAVVMTQTLNQCQLRFLFKFHIRISEKQIF